MAVAKAAAPMFDRVDVVGTRNFPDAKARGVVPAITDVDQFLPVRLLRRLKSKFKKTGDNVTPKTGVLDGPPTDISAAGVPGRLFRRIRAAAYGKNFQRLFFREPDIDVERHVLIQYIQPFVMDAIGGMAGRTGEPFGNVTVHWVFRDDPQSFCATRRIGDSELRGILRRLAASGSPASRFYADTDALSEAYEALMEGNVAFRTLPIPVLAREPGAREKREDGKTLRLGVLGDQRAEKGIALFPRAIRSLPGRIAGRDVVFHIQDKADPADRIAERAMRALKEMAGARGIPEIRFLGETADPRTYMDNYAEMDVSVILYDSPRYRRSSSGVFVEALHLGIPVIVFSGTWMAGVVAGAERMGMKIGEAIDSVDAFAPALARIADNLDEYRDGAEKHGRHWKQIHTPERLVEILLEKRT